MAVLNNVQEEQIREIGTHLQKLRQQQSRSIEEVAAKTCIRLRMLKALEEGKLDDLPEPIYIQGFIRRYGDFLGLDGNALAKTFSTDYPPVEFDAQAILGNNTGKKPDVEIYEPNLSDQSSEVPEIDAPAAPPPAKKIPPYLAYITLGVAAVVALVYAINKPRTLESAAQKQQAVTASPVKSTPTPIDSTSISKSPTVSPTELATQPIPTSTPEINTSPSPTVSPAELATQPTPTSTPEINTSPSPTVSPAELATQPTPTSTPEINTSPSPTVSPAELATQPTPTSTPEINTSPSPTVSPAELATQPTPAGTPTTNTLGGVPIQVTVNLQEESWVRVTADGKTLFEGILQKGTQQSFSAEKQLTIRSGNAGAVLVSVNQKEAQPLGKLGSVKQVTFTPEQ